MKDTLIQFLMILTLIPHVLVSNHKDNTHRVIHVGNVTENTYKVTVFDAHSKSHETALLPPGATQYMFCRTERISQLSFEPQHPIGQTFAVYKPLSEMYIVKFTDHGALRDNFHFYLFPDHTVKSFPAVSTKDKEIIAQAKKHLAPQSAQNLNNKAFTSSFLQASS